MTGRDFLHLSDGYCTNQTVLRCTTEFKHGSMVFEKGWRCVVEILDPAKTGAYVRIIDAEEFNDNVVFVDTEDLLQSFKVDNDVSAFSIITKFNIGEKAWIMDNNSPVQVKVIGLAVYRDREKNPFYVTYKIDYLGRLCSGENLFKTKEDLLKSFM